MGSNVIVVIGAGSIGQAIARRIAAGKHVLLADLRQENADAAAEALSGAGFETSTTVVDVSSPDSVDALVETSTDLGAVTAVSHAAGVSASQATIEQVLSVDLYGTALVLDKFGQVIAPGGSAVVISSQSGHRMPALSIEEDRLLATTPVEELLALPLLQHLRDGLHAYQISKRANGLRVQAEAMKWGRREARVNAISPGIIITPLARDELSGANGAGYQRMIQLAPAGRPRTPDEVATVGELLMSERGSFISGSDILIDGGATASFFYRPLAGLAPTPTATPTLSSSSSSSSSSKEAQ